MIKCSVVLFYECCNLVNCGFHYADQAEQMFVLRPPSEISFPDFFCSSLWGVKVPFTGLKL